MAKKKKNKLKAQIKKAITTALPFVGVALTIVDALNEIKKENKRSGLNDVIDIEAEIINSKLNDGSRR